MTELKRHDVAHVCDNCGSEMIEPIPAEALMQVITNPTREDRLRIYYRAFAGEYPGPNRAAVAALLANRMVEIEDDDE